MRSLRPAQLAQSLEAIFEAAAVPELWPDAIHEFSLAAGAEGSILLALDGADGHFRFSEGLGASIPDYIKGEWYRQNAALRLGAISAARGEPVQTEWLLYGAEEYLRDPFHMEFLRPNGFGWFAGLFLVQAGGATVTISPQRRRRDEPFSPAELEAFARIMPQLRQVGRLAQASGFARTQGVLDAFALLEVPAFLLNAAGKVTRLNPPAEALMGQGLDLVGGRLIAARPQVTAQIQRLAHAVTRARLTADPHAGGPVAAPRLTARPLFVHGAPLVGAAQDVFQYGKGILTIVDPDAGRPDAELRLQQAWGLSPAESETAALLAQGVEVSEIAQRRGVGVETVRSQLKSIGVRTGLRRRGEQVALFSRTLSLEPRTR